MLVLGVVGALGLFGEALVLVVDVDTEVDGTRHGGGSDQEQQEGNDEQPGDHSSTVSDQQHQHKA